MGFIVYFKKMKCIGDVWNSMDLNELLRGSVKIVVIPVFSHPLFAPLMKTD